MVGSVAVVDQVDVLASYLWNIESAHSEHLMAAIKQILADASLSLQKLDGVAVSIGPGSFTGLRIGLEVCPMLDAKKGEVYASVYQVAGGEIERLSAPQAISPELLAKRISQPTVFSGRGAIVYRETILKILREKAHFAPPDLNYPDAAAVARVGLSAIEKGEEAELFSIEPLYIRKPDAKISGQPKL